jgi:hypothetical protein
MNCLARSVFGEVKKMPALRRHSHLSEGKQIDQGDRRHRLQAPKSLRFAVHLPYFVGWPY